MDGHELDDWELDDWEDESFDEDVWDASQADLEPDEGLDPDAGHDLDAAAASGGGVWASPPGRAGGGGTAVAWSAWEIGTVFALGGWLADRHAEQVGGEVRRALASRGADTSAAAPRRAPRPPPPSGRAYGSVSGGLASGDPLDPLRLYADLAAALRAGDDLLIQAEGPDGPHRALLLVLSVVPLAAGPRVWVVAEEHRGGFGATRLVPVFQPERTSGLALFATDLPAEAVDAADWACRREGAGLDTLFVTERRRGARIEP